MGIVNRLWETKRQGAAKASGAVQWAHSSVSRIPQPSAEPASRVRPSARCKTQQAQLRAGNSPENADFSTLP